MVLYREDFRRHHVKYCCALFRNALCKPDLGIVLSRMAFKHPKSYSVSTHGSRTPYSLHGYHRVIRNQQSPRRPQTCVYFGVPPHKQIPSFINARSRRVIHLRLEIRLTRKTKPPYRDVTYHHAECREHVATARNRHFIHRGRTFFRNKS